MTILVNQKSALDAYLLECTTLAGQIAETNQLLTQTENQFVADGYKKPNLKSIISTIKKSNKTLEQTFFKNVSGTVSISATQVNSALDLYVREKLAVLITKDITSSAVEPVKVALLKTKILLSKNYGIPSTTMKKILDIYASDPDFFVKSGSISLQLLDGYKLVSPAVLPPSGFGDGSGTTPTLFPNSVTPPAVNDEVDCWYSPGTTWSNVTEPTVSLSEVDWSYHLYPSSLDQILQQQELFGDERNPFFLLKYMFPDGLFSSNISPEASSHEILVRFNPIPAQSYNGQESILANPRISIQNLDLPSYFQFNLAYSRSNVMKFIFFMKGEGTLKIYKNQDVYFQYPSQITYDNTNLSGIMANGPDGWVPVNTTEIVASYYEPNYLNAMNQYLDPSLPEETRALVQEVIDYAGETNILTKAVVLPIGATKLKFQFTPTSPGSVCRLFMCYALDSRDVGLDIPV